MILIDSENKMYIVELTVGHLIYINDLVDDVSSDAKLFADDTSLFTVVYDETVAADQLNRDLKVVTDWAYQWKMQFNPDINKQAV